MVSKASDDLPEPLRPVITTNRSLGITTSIFLRLCSLAPLMIMLCWSIDIILTQEYLLMHQTRKRGQIYFTRKCKINLSVRSNNCLSNGLKSRPGNYPYTPVVQGSGV